MVRKKTSHRWSGPNKHPQDDSSPIVVVPIDRTYVDFGDDEESEAAVERWLTSPSSSSTQTFSSRESRSPSSPKALPTGSGKIRQFFGSTSTKTPIMESSPTRMAKKYSPTQGKRLLRERLESRSKGLGKSSPQQTATVTPNGIRDKLSGKKSPATMESCGSSQNGNNNAFSFNDFAGGGSDGESHHHHHHVDPEKEEAFQNRLIVPVVSTERFNDNAKHPRRSIDMADNTSSSPILGALPRELPQPPKRPQSIPPDSSSPDRSSPSRKSLGRAATTRRRPPDESAEDVKKSFFASNHRRRSSVGSGSVETERTTVSDTKKSGFFSSRRRSLAENSVETEKTAETKIRFFGRQRSSVGSPQQRSSVGSVDSETTDQSSEKESTGPIMTVSRTESIPSEHNKPQSRCGSIPDVPMKRYVLRKAEEAIREVDDEREKIRLDRIHTAQKQPQQQQQPSRQLTVHARTNRIKLNVYDLLHDEVVMQLPWGLLFPIGQCFNVVNSGLHNLGTGAYHVGVEVRTPRGGSHVFTSRQLFGISNLSSFN
jgi:hypothetical protein